jgi:hypothetical protein
MLKYNTEYLIMHEDDVDWNEISEDPEQYLSLVETRLFRKRINWKVYLPLHQSSITHSILECASKYFNPEIYEILAGFDIVDDEFILNHREKFDYKLLIENAHVGADVLLETSNLWKDIPDIEKSFQNAKHIDINSDKYEQVKLILDCI